MMTPEEQQYREDPFPKIDFMTFVFSLNAAALSHLGLVADPASGERKKDLALARQTIDILGMLEEKTRGNLTPDESKSFAHLLRDLRLRYVQASRT